MRSTKAGPIVGKALEEFDPQNGKGEIIECPTEISSLFGDKINQKNEDNTQKTGSIEKQHPSSSLIESHNLPLSANNNETVAQPTIPSNPNTTTGQRELSTPPVNTGNTNEARNTSEKLAKTDDNARNLDRVNLNINNEYNKQLSNLSNLKCGKIMAFINISWYDPDVYLTSTGDLKIVQTDAVEEFVYSGNLTNSSVYGQASGLSLQNFQLLDAAGQTINRVGAFAEIAAAKIKTGLIETENAIVNNVLIVKNIVSQTLQTTTIISNTIVGKIISAQKITSPVVETKDLIATGTAALTQIKTNEIKPQDRDLVINLDNNSQDRTAAVLEPTPSGTAAVNETGDKGPLAKLIIKGLEGKTVAVIDASGNASFSGTLTAAQIESEKLKVKSLEGHEATLSGKLIAKEVEAENINKISDDVRTGLDLSLQNTNNINDIQALLAEIKNTPLPDLTNQTNLANSTNLNNQQLNNETIQQFNN